MPATTASDQILTLPIELKPLYDRLARMPNRPAHGAWFQFSDLNASNFAMPRRGAPKCEFPTGQARAFGARLEFPRGRRFLWQTRTVQIYWWWAAIPSACNGSPTM